MENGENCMQKELMKNVQNILNQYTSDKSNLIQILNEIQETFGYVPMVAQEKIAEYLNISMADVYGVVTFYSRFTTTPSGKYKISVCLGTACYVKNSEKILDRIKTRLGIEPGQTTEDGKFSLDTTRCVGACGLAPVFMINEEVYGKATIEKLDKVLDEYMSKEE